jgi:[acyl-carrier-protein] S-malonyltransferase
LSPNTYLVVGQGDTVQRFRAEMKDQIPVPVHIRINEHRWPPLHTTIVRQDFIADRAGLLLEKLHTGPFPPRPEVISLVTGRRGYAEHTARETLRQWVDHPQRLWDGICEVLASDVKTILHFGPEPNLIPATFARLRENIQALGHGHWAQTYGMKAVTSMARRPWLATILPARAALLRAPFVRHVVVEDWLLDNAP